MKEYKVRDLVRIAGAHPLASYSGRVIAVEKQSAAQTYAVEMELTGLVSSFAESQLELIKRELRQNA